MKKQFKLVPKMISNNCADIWCVSGNDDAVIVGRILFPADGQMNDNLECLQDICTSLKKRIRKSI